jgi:hypothetical protein
MWKPSLWRKNKPLVRATVTESEGNYFVTGRDTEPIGYIESDGAGGFQINTEAVSGLPVLVRGGNIYLRV